MIERGRSNLRAEELTPHKLIPLRHGIFHHSHTFADAASGSKQQPERKAAFQHVARSN